MNFQNPSYNTTMHNQFRALSDDELKCMMNYDSESIKQTAKEILGERETQRYWDGLQSTEPSSHEANSD